MTRRDRNSLIAAGIILIGLVVAAYFLPVLMLAAGEISPVAAALVAVVFLLGFFAIFFLRARRGGDRH